MTRAVVEDEKRNYENAYYLYCDGLQYFIPLITAENDAAKRLHLQKRATGYMERAEEIKRSINQSYLNRRIAPTTEAETEAPCTSNTENPVKKAIEPKDSFKQLRKYSNFAFLF